jgi:hypothetical protein
MVDARAPLRNPLSSGAFEIEVEAGELRFRSASGEVFFAFKLAAFIGYEKPSENRPLRLLSAAPDHWVFETSDSYVNKRIELTLRGEFLDYQLFVTPCEPTPPIACVHYAQSGPEFAAASAHRFEEFYIVCPDRYGSAIPAQGKVGFKLGVPSFRFEKDNGFPHEGGRTIIAPYVTALKVGESWLGVGTLEIPASEYGLNMTFCDGRAVIDFRYGGNLRLTESYAFPRITFFVGDDKIGTCKKYIDRLYADGLAQHNEEWQPEWGGPIYCFFSDQMYEYQTDRSTQNLEGEMTMTDNYCNEQFLERCLAFLVEKAIDYRVIIIDYGWFVQNGDWQPNQKRFSDFKATIKKLQAMGKKVLIWYSPYFNAEASPNYREHPEIGVKKRDGKPFFVVRFGTEVNYQSDFTHPAMRELCVKDIEFMLSPAGLDADGIKVDCTHQPPTIDNVFFDPSWGTGELMHYRASKLMYDTAKRIKADACINATAGNPLFNRTYDLHRIHDALEYNLDAYEERAWAAWLCGAGMSDLDDWPSYDLYTVRANLRKIAYGVPSLYAAKKRGTERKIKVSWGYSASVREDELELLSSLYGIYAKVPASLEQRVHIDPFRKEFWRCHGTGKLNGFFAATTLSGNQAAAVYDESRAYVVSITDAPLVVPLPPGAHDVAVSRLGRDGGSTPVETFEVIDGSVVFETCRCARDVRWFEVSYAL